MNWKKLIGAAAAAGVLLALTACARANSGQSASQSPGQTSSAPQSAASGGCRTGLGVHLTADAQGADAAVQLTAAAVVLDEAGRIQQAVVDVTDLTGSAAPDGQLLLPEGYLTRRQEQTAEGRAWAQQADALCAWLTGRTSDGLQAIVLDEAGLAADPALAQVCGLPLTPLLTALQRACDTAAALGTGEADRLTLAIVADHEGSRRATDDADGVLLLTGTILAMTQNVAGQVTAAVCDEAELRFGVSSDGALEGPDAEELRTKLQQGDDYGMKTASQAVGIGLEWYRQSEGFCQYLTEKTAGQIAGISDEGGTTADPDLAARCTVDMTRMLAAALQAAER